MIGLSVTGILYGACLALVQRDFWKLMAYAALSHFGLILLGIYGFTFTGSTGAVYQILSHSVIDGALFLLLGALEIRAGSSEIAQYGGFASRTPKLAAFFVFSSLAMIGLPMLSGFVGEFTVLSSTFTDVSRSWTVAATLGVVLGAAYMLSLVQKIFYGAESKLATGITDLKLNEGAVVVPLVLLMLVMGLTPAAWFTAIQTAFQPISTHEANYSEGAR
jgi:NADH-quinone oxidoreductase subunit M